MAPLVVDPDPVPPLPAVPEPLPPVPVPTEPALPVVPVPGVPVPAVVPPDVVPLVLPGFGVPVAGAPLVFPEFGLLAELLPPPHPNSSSAQLNANVDRERWFPPFIVVPLELSTATMSALSALLSNSYVNSRVGTITDCDGRGAKIREDDETRSNSRLQSTCGSIQTSPCM